ncbi:hypothetical protein D3C76_675840 [compost metagenome]
MAVSPALFTAVAVVVAAVWAARAAGMAVRQGRVPARWAVVRAAAAPVVTAAVMTRPTWAVAAVPPLAVLVGWAFPITATAVMVRRPPMARFPLAAVVAGPVGTRWVAPAATRWAGSTTPAAARSPSLARRPLATTLAPVAAVAVAVARAAMPAMAVWAAGASVRSGTKAHC